MGKLFQSLELDVSCKALSGDACVLSISFKSEIRLSTDILLYVLIHSPVLGSMIAR